MADFWLISMHKNIYKKYEASSTFSTSLPWSSYHSTQVA